MSVTVGISGQIMPPADKALERARQADTDGFDSIWWPDHLMGWHPDSVWTEEFTPLAAYQGSAHVHFDPLVMMGTVGATTEHIRVGVGVTDLIRRHPAMLAMEGLTVDHFSKGRSILGLGSGERLNVIPYGMEWRKPVGRLAEAIDVIRMLWETDKPITFHGDFFNLEDAVLGMEPYEGKQPPIWLASHGPRMLELLGTKADGWLPTKMTPEEYAVSLGKIREAAERAGRDPDAIEPSMLGYVLCAPDEEALQRLTEHKLVRMLCVLLPAKVYELHGSTMPFEGSSGFHSFVPTTVSREEALRVIDHIPPAMVRYGTFHGDEHQITEQIRAYEQAGMKNLVLWNVTAFGDPSLAGYSFRTLRAVKDLLAAPATVVP